MTKRTQTYKDGIFRRLFRDEATILELYRALSGREYLPDTKVEIITLQDSVFGDLKNDLAFVIEDRLIILIEHQSTMNPNMPLRMLSYLVREYEKLYYSRAIYSKTLIQIPTPELYVFYNGRTPAPKQWELKLSDAFLENCDTITVEAKVKVVNINYEDGAELLNRCRMLNEYSRFIAAVRTEYAQSGDAEEAIRTAIRCCIKQNILREFLERNGGEIMSFVYQALTREECEKIREEDGYIRGFSEGCTEGESKRQKRDARAMKQENIAEDVIVRVTGLSPEEVQAL